MNRIEREKRVVGLMIELYCRKHEGNSALCDDCRQLRAYALERLSRCPFGNGKSTCRQCTVHCYSPQMRQRISAIMRWSGPRMMLYHPIEAIRHIINEL